MNKQPLFVNSPNDDEGGGFRPPEVQQSNLVDLSVSETTPEPRLAPSAGEGNVRPRRKYSLILRIGLLCVGLIAPIVHYFIWEHSVAQPRLLAAKENCLRADNDASEAKHRLELARLSRRSAEASKSQAINIAQTVEKLLDSAINEHDRKIDEAVTSAKQRETIAEEAARGAQLAELTAKNRKALEAQNPVIGQNPPERNPSISQAVVNELNQFIDAYVAAQSSNDINTHKSLYGDKVNYSYKSGISTRQEVLMDFEQTIRRWPIRYYQIVPGGPTATQTAANQFLLKLSLTYQYSSRDKRASGKTDLSMSVNKQDGTWRVVEWSEKVTK
ncbi:MAG: hypothetical protein WCO57_03940 [Verrucomicrobiota bacterium]